MLRQLVRDLTDCGCACRCLELTRNNKKYTLVAWITGGRPSFLTSAVMEACQLLFCWEHYLSSIVMQ